MPVIYTQSTYLIEQTNASGSIAYPRAVCRDFKQAIAWCYVQLSAHMPIIIDDAGELLPIDQWEFNIVAGVYIAPIVGHELPMQYRVRMIEELTLS